MAEERVQRRLAAILAADVVGYSRLIGVDEAGTRSRFNTLMDTVVRLAIERHRGRLVKTMGDGLLAEFASVVDAVQCAADVQRDAAAHVADEAEDRRLRFRVGIHLGDVIVEDEDIHGDGVNVAARLEGLAEPGGICVSDMVRSGVRGKLALSFDDLGEKSLKNITEPLRVYRAVLDRTESGGATVSDDLFRRPAVAVLPFENLSGDPEQEYFADGLTEDIITALSQWRAFPVIARNSTFVYKGKSLDLRQIGEELGARYLIEGSVRRSGNRVRVTAQLINAETGHHVWAERYDREIGDFFDLQDEITQQIASIIEPTIERDERRRLSTKPTTNLTAWELCLRGYDFIYGGGQEENRKARKMFERAIAIDPGFARSYTGLAYTYIRDIRYFRVSNSEELIQRMMENARRAVALDETDARARTMMARAYNMAGDPESGLADARRAMEINPYDADSHNILGACLALTSARYAEGVQSFQRALRLNPMDPLTHVFLNHLALAELGDERYDAAAGHAREALRRSPEFFEAQIVLSSSLGYLGRTKDARGAIRESADSTQQYIDSHPLYSRDLKDRLFGGLRKAGLL
jgi:adenylate cyclase